MDDSVLIKVLDSFGLNNYESRVYSALFKKKQLTAAEVARLADIPRTRAYDNLRSLELKGLCEVMSGKTKLYSLYDPSKLKDVLIKLENDKASIKIKKHQEEIEKERNRLEKRAREAEKLAANLMPLFEQSRSSEGPLDYIEVFKSVAMSNSKFMELSSEAHKEILIFSKPPFLAKTYELRRKSVAPQIEAIERGVKLITIHEIPSEQSKRKKFFRETFDVFEPDKEQLRVIDNLPLKMSIYDEKVALFSLYDPIIGESSISSFLARNEAFAKSLKELFYMYWDKADELSKYEDEIK